MKAGKGRTTWQAGKAATAALAIFVAIGLSGCAAHQKVAEKNVQAKRFIHDRNQGAAENYLLGCPDLVHLTVASYPVLNGDYAIGADGRVQLTPQVPVRIEGCTTTEAAAKIAQVVGTSSGNVGVEVAEFRSQYVILFGQVIGWQRVIPYRGQETVLDLLKRTGGITRGAAPESIYVVRTHVEDGQRPEIFHVDLPAIVDKKDERTNIRILPYDQIYVGETRVSRIEKLIPPCLRPIYQMFWNTRPDRSQPGGG